jgi:hypothetical protein
MPIAVFFAGRGHSVYRVSSAKAADSPGVVCERVEDS